jgi:xanthine dehydrogenase molybdopterin-binding subunit B
MSTFAFGYLRRLPGMDKEAVRRALDELAAFTGRQGLELTGVHYEHRVSERLSTWCQLIADCRNEEITNVVVPSSQHFHRAPELAAFMQEELAAAIRGTVWVADSADGDTTGGSETAAHHE